LLFSTLSALDREIDWPGNVPQNSVVIAAGCETASLYPLVRRSGNEIAGLIAKLKRELLIAVILTHLGVKIPASDFEWHVDTALAGSDGS
jgi:hypothetical protein